MKLQRRKIQEAATARTVEQEQWEQQWCFESRAKCWAGQKVCAGFSVRCYGKTQRNFLASSMLQCFNEPFPSATIRLLKQEVTEERREHLLRIQ